MKLLRYGRPGGERPGLSDSGGTIRDLGDHIVDWVPEETAPERLRRIGELNPQTLRGVPEDARIGPVLGGIGKFVAIGLNYLGTQKHIVRRDPSLQ